MKKILILAYDFPPYVSVGGLRPYTWFKFLKEFDIEPIVITRAWENKHGNGLDYITPSTNTYSIISNTTEGVLIKTPYFPTLSNKLLLRYGENKFNIIRKLNTAWYEFTQFLWISGPRKELYKAAELYLRDNKVDAILATGEPFVTFFYASKLGAKFNIPWIADYRDPWSQKKVIKNIKGFYQWNKFFEGRIVPSACKVITVSDAVKKTMFAPINSMDIEVISNGYDPVAMEQAHKVEQNTKVLTISLAGSLYKWHPWKSFLEQVEDVCKATGQTIKINFYGVNIPGEIETFVADKGGVLYEHVTVLPKMLNEELLLQLASENVLLLFNDYSIHGTKVFDYVGLKRKVLLCYANDPKANELKDLYFNIETGEDNSRQLQREVVEDTQCGIVAEDENHLKDVLLQLLKEFQQNGAIACNSVNVERYSRKIQVEKLANLIKAI